VRSVDRCWLFWLRFGDSSDDWGSPTTDCHNEHANYVNYFNDKHNIQYDNDTSAY
jgi:hypothetical protein